jgi:plastocyanin
LQVRPGETVRWVNEDAVPHTVTSSAGREILRAPLDSSYLMRGDAYDYTFPEAGRFEYLCVPHMDQAPMREATVTVVE